MFLGSKEESSFSEEKEAKRLLCCGGSRPGWEREPGGHYKKSFCFFFFRKRRVLLPCLSFFLLSTAAQAEPALWLVQQGKARIYLFGTMHILPHPANWFSPKIKAALDASPALWEEADVQPGNSAGIASLMAKAVDQKYDLWSDLRGDDADKFKRELTACHMTPELVAHFRPWFATLLPAICALQEAGASSRSGAELVLTARATEEKKQLAYFETVEQQINYLATATVPAQLGALHHSIQDDNASPAFFSKMEDEWLNGDEKSLASLVDESRPEDPAAYKVLITERNERFARRIADLLRDGQSAFVAVGAGHFAGDSSVLVDLGKMGIKASRQ
jgi:hypothetical protein